MGIFKIIKWGALGFGSLLILVFVVFGIVEFNNHRKALNFAEQAREEFTPGVSLIELLAKHSKFSTLILNKGNTACLSAFNFSSSHKFISVIRPNADVKAERLGIAETLQSMKTQISQSDCRDISVTYFFGPFSRTTLSFTVDEAARLATAPGFKTYR